MLQLILTIVALILVTVDMAINRALSLLHVSVVLLAVVLLLGAAGIGVLR